MENTVASEITYKVYNDMPEEEVVALAKKGENNAVDFLIRKYKKSVIVKARSYFLIGADKEDIIQEGMIGLFKAIRDYNVNRQSSFKSFAELCISRQMITAIKAATRQKHLPLNSYISLNKPVYDDDSERTMIDLIANYKNQNPEQMIISKEEKGAMKKNMKSVLSSLEWQVLSLYLEGRSYQEIAEEMDREVKSIDNALQRVKKKLEKTIRES